MRTLARRLVPRGLRWRLAASFTLVMALCLGIAFVAVYRGTGTNARQQIDRELSADAAEAAQNLHAARPGSSAELARAARDYLQTQSFNASSRLLFVAMPGQPTVSNSPELVSAQAPDDGESAPAQRAENSLALGLARAPQRYTTLPAPDNGELRVLKIPVRLPNGLTATVGAGEALTAVSRAQHSVARAFVLAGLLALAAALIASYFVGARVSSPLRGMAGVAARVDAGDLHPRIEHREGEASEIRVLSDAFNHMLDRLTEAFAGQREFIADASHELRTPLTVIRGQLEVLAAQEHPSASEVRRVEALVQSEVARVSRLVDDLLLLARSDHSEQFLRPEQIELAGYVRKLWDGMTLLADRRFELGGLPAGALLADRDRLAQALRNLIGNAINHTAPDSGLVRLEVRVEGRGRIRFLVDDDGPGIPPAERERVFNRFHRTDAARDRASGGTGLGLAIVRAIAEAHGGTVSAASSPEGGARLELLLPGFRPAHDSGVRGAATPTRARLTTAGSRPPR
ncbi:MAG TPA: HAMP domain-containing sensor histidine kinase [Solirubrobacteraceae bacterium]|nr:HAMP domain-containing sensor histidine kinase [Solirubrobacteraceae bacterium]